MYVVHSGCVKAYRRGHGGDEQIIAFMTAGDIFPESSLSEAKVRSVCYYETVEDSTIITIDHAVYCETLVQQPLLKVALFDYVTHNYASYIVQALALVQPNAADKLLTMLYYLVLRHGVVKKNGDVWLNVKMRHVTLAGLTGLSRETVTTELGQLKRQGVVHYSFRRFVIHTTVLKAALGDNFLLKTNAPPDNEASRNVKYRTQIL